MFSYTVNTIFDARDEGNGKFDLWWIEILGKEGRKDGQRRQQHSSFAKPGYLLWSRTSTTNMTSFGRSTEAARNGLPLVSADAALTLLSLA
jgi:hypothetical protein